jgi:tyrosine-protein phosphatase YwqE
VYVRNIITHAVLCAIGNIIIHVVGKIHIRCVQINFIEHKIIHIISVDIYECEFRIFTITHLFILNSPICECEFQFQ